MKKLAVVAFGGNALLRSGQKGTIDDQEANTYETCEKLLRLIKKDYDLVITHGNGPQVGNIILRNIAGERMFGIPAMPLDISGAYSQGFIGYMIEQQLRNVLQKNEIERDIISIITQVLVDKNDPAFQSPKKPVGIYYTKEEADNISKETKDVFGEDPKGKGWRKLVASPRPYRIQNRKSIETLVRNGHIVIAVGGGGIPVFYVEEDKLQGIDAVIDKDLASSLLATQIGADEFFILTDVPNVCINFNTPQEKALSKLSVSEARKHLEDGQFSEGSMGPKVRAAIQFVENGGRKSIIKEASNLHDKNSGTEITLY